MLPVFAFCAPKSPAAAKPFSSAAPAVRTALTVASSRRACERVSELGGSMISSERVAPIGGHVTQLTYNPPVLTSRVKAASCMRFPLASVHLKISGRHSLYRTALRLSIVINLLHRTSYRETATYLSKGRHLISLLPHKLKGYSRESSLVSLRVKDDRSCTLYN